jgi:hypothetical protein
VSECSNSYCLTIETPHKVILTQEFEL